MLQPQEILTPAEVASRLKVPETWVYEKTRKRCGHALPCFRIGRYLRFSWPAVSAWVESTQPGKRKGA
jgi:excisionase family DNA binding protein